MSSTLINSMITAASYSQITAMPVKRDSDLPTYSETTTSSSETSSYTYSASVPEVTNPYIETSTLPNNLVFIIVGAILALMLMTVICYRLATYLMSNITAKNEKEVYYSNFLLGSGSDGSSVSSNSLFLNGSSHNFQSTDSLPLSTSGSIMSKQFDQHHQGRSYRNAMSNSAGNRGSMFISPMLEMMHLKSQSNLDLPLYNSNRSVLGLDDSSLFSIYNGNSASSPMIEKKEKLKRPPSQFLDDLINADDFDL